MRGSVTPILTNLEGRVKNTSLPYSRGLLPVFEAVVNAIHAIEAKSSTSTEDKIVVSILRSEEEPELIETRPGKPALGKIEGFIISDTGIGFDKENFEAFQELDTSHKRELGGRGIGRLMWLKAFDCIEIESIYSENEKKYKRCFSFSVKNGLHNTSVVDELNTAQVGSVIKLQGFYEKYRKQVHKTGELVARDILEHCMWYFLREGSAPEIVVVDGATEYLLSEIYDDSIGRNAWNESFEVKDVRFDITHVKMRNASGNESYAAYCADNRVVTLSRFSGPDAWIDKKLVDDAGEFCYQCFVTSPYLNEHVKADRLSFDFDGDIGELFEDAFLSKEEIGDAVRQRVHSFLEKEREIAKKNGKARLRTFVEKSAPRYRVLIEESEDDVIPADITDRELDMLCHRKYADMEQRVLEEGHELNSVLENSPFEEIKDKIDSFFANLDKLKSTELAMYVYYRHMVLELLKTLIRKRPENGGYAKEEMIHKLIFPMRKTSEGLFMENENLWIIDERLVFHHFLSSDKTINSLPILNSDSVKRPDIFQMREIIENAEDDVDLNEHPLVVSNTGVNPARAGFTIIEFKRPMRDDATPVENPITQVLEYFSLIREGKAQTLDGRPIYSKSDPGFGYVIADLTEKMRKACVIAGMHETNDGEGYFWYNEPMKVYLEVISYDKLYNAAYERNCAFFEQLGLPHDNFCR